MKRLDVLTAQKYGISRSLSSKLIRQGKVLFNSIVEDSPDKQVQESLRDNIFVSEGDLVQEEIPSYIIPEERSLDVIYEDENVLVINKEAGISVHTSLAEPTGTILNALVGRYIGLEKEFGTERPGIVHRLDKDTSGVLIVAKNRHTQSYLAGQFKDRTVHKEYDLIVSGIIAESITVDKAISRNKKDRKKMGVNIDGRPALTTFIPQAHFFRDKEHRYTRLLARPKTGRTHQIRVHAKSLGHPIVGDKIYNGEKNDHLLLHAYMLRISIPGKGQMEFKVDPPVSFDSFLSTLHQLPNEKTRRTT